MNEPATQQRVSDKWGTSALGGFQLVPDLLIKSQAKLGLGPTELVVLLNLTMHWWYRDQRPFPRSSVIAKRMDVQTRTIQRALERLRSLGLLQKVKERGPDGDEREVCDLSGLVEALAKLAPQDPDYVYRISKNGGAYGQSAER